MRKIEDIDLDIATVRYVLRLLMAERKLLIDYLQGIEASSEILTEKVIDRMKDDKGWEKGL